MSTRFLALAGSLAVALLVAEGGALADDRQTGPTPVDSTAPASTTVVAPPNSGGVTVVVPTAGGGTVTATGCSTVVVNGAPTLVSPTGAPCPLPAYQPYQPYASGPAPYYDVRPKYAPDPDRKAAVIASAIGFGVGGAVAGVMYLVQYSDDYSRCRSGHYVNYSDGTGRWEKDESACGGGGSRASLLTYGAIVTFLPSLPRFVVGDTNRGLVYTGLRGASFATAALVNWGNNSETSWQGPFLLGFVVPLTLGIIDLATTPHREDLVSADKVAKPRVTSLAPVAISDRQGKPHGAVLTLEGLF